MTKFYFAASDLNLRHIYVFPSRAKRDEQMARDIGWLPLESREAKKRAEMVGRLYLSKGIDVSDLPKCTLSRIHWVYDGDTDSWYGCKVARLAAW